MENASEAPSHICPVCQYEWQGQGDYCPNCKAPVSEGAKAAQLADAKGCQFFMLMIFACFFGFIGIALTVVGITAKSHDDPVATKFFLGGLLLVFLSAGFGYLVYMKLSSGASDAGKLFEREDKDK